MDKITESQKNLVIKEDALTKNNNQLVLESASKRNLILAKKQELNSISETKKEKQELINGLHKSEKLFKIQLKRKQKRANDLDEEIRKIIVEEMSGVANSDQHSFSIPLTVDLNSGDNWGTLH